MNLVVNPPKPLPNWQAPVSTRKTQPTIMERAVEGEIRPWGVRFLTIGSDGLLKFWER